MVMRFFVGFTATACWVGNAHIVISWYTHQELGKRNAIYSCVWPLGSMFAGYLQSPAYERLNNVHKLEGWSCLFIICAIITIPCALVGVFFCPNVPNRTNSRFLNARERELCVYRLLKDGFAKTRGVDRTLFKRIFGNWRIFVFFTVGNLFWMTPYPSGIPYTLWLDANPKYSVSMVNNLSTIITPLRLCLIWLRAGTLITETTDGKQWLMEAFLLLSAMCCYLFGTCLMV